MAKQLGSLRFRFLCLLSVLAATVLTTGVSHAQTGRFSRLDAYIEAAMADWEVPGLAIAIIKDDRVVHERGFGTRTMGAQEPVDEHTLFAIASNSKAFTATALGLLVQEGKIAWDDPVLNVMPEFQMYDPVVTRKICIRDLLCHRSGLGLWAGDLTWWDSTYDRAEVIRRIRFQKPVADFRTTYRYTNLMFLVAGQIIPEVTGISWDRFLKQRFFSPLGMDRTSTSVNDLAKQTNVATPHAIVDDKLVAINYLNVDNCAPAAAVNSSVHDLSHWVRLHLNEGLYNGKRIVDTRIIMETRKPHTMITISEKAKSLNPFTHFSTYGLGFRTHDYRGRLVVNHTGGLDGMLSYVGFIPGEDIGVILLTNSDNHGLHRVLPFYVFDLLLGIDEKDWSQVYLENAKEGRKRDKEREQRRLESRTKDTRPSLPLEKYAGTYTSAVYGAASVTHEDGQLKLKLAAHPQFEAAMTHWQYDTFLATWDHRLWGASDVYFESDGHGKVARFRIAVRPDWLDTLEYSFVRDD